MALRRVGTGGTESANGVPPVAPASTAAGSRGLSIIGQSGKDQPDRIVVYGPEGIGKTTFAAGSEAPIFIPTEEGLRSVKVDCFPEPKTWLEIFEYVETLRKEEHAYKTLVIDTADNCEKLCQAFILARDKKDSIESYGFGKGYVMVSETFKTLLSALDALRLEKGMDIVITAHSLIRTFQNPLGDNFDRMEMKLDKRTGSLLKEWCDILLFAGYDIAVDTAKGHTKGKGYGGDRVIYTTHAAAYDAKNRHNLPAQLPCDPREFWSILHGGKQ